MSDWLTMEKNLLPRLFVALATVFTAALWVGVRAQSADATQLVAKADRIISAAAARVGPAACVTGAPCLRSPDRAEVTAS